jgi:hypothetical protein
VTRVLIAGIPRSGTTWVGRTLGMVPGAVYLHEPDNDMGHPFALRAKGMRGRFPLLEPGESASRYERLWRAAFGDQDLGPLHQRVGQLRNRVSMAIARRTPRAQLQRALSAPRERRPARVAAAAWIGVPAVPARSEHVVVKSVHAPLALEWIANRCDPAIVIVLRHPLNVLASVLELGLPDRDRGLDADPVIRERIMEPLGIAAPPPGASDPARSAWQVGLLTAALEAAAARHPDWIVATHEDLCVDPIEKFRPLCERIGLPWSPGVERHLAESDRPGSGFSTNRVRSDEPTRWRQRLNAQQLDEIVPVLRGFSLSRWDLDRSIAAGGTT